VKHYEGKKLRAGMIGQKKYHASTLQPEETHLYEASQQMEVSSKGKERINFLKELTKF
jgi:hypothetical protein